MKWITKNVLLLLLIVAPFYSLSAADRISDEKPSLDDPQEVYLTFNYQNLFNIVVTALYDQDEDQFYLPVSEVLNALKVPHEVDLDPPLVTGTYLGADNDFRINFSDFTAEIDEKGNFEYNTDLMIIGETDFYMTPKIFQDLFDIDLSIDFNNLLLRLETDRTLPVVAEDRRERERRQASRFSLRQDFYDLKFERERKILAGGFLDYSLSANVNSQNTNFYSYNFSLGSEILGGDLQGSASGNYSSNNSNFLTDNLRWRYAWRDNPYITQAIGGQTSSDGLNSRQFTGVRLTNDPIEPRYIYDEIDIQGNVAPDSEVELYFNDALYDYQRVEENGRYRFEAPLTYGSSRLNLRIYDPSGGVREEERRIRVPYDFQPPGRLIYHFNAGRVNNPIFGSTQQSNIIQGDAAYGISNWLTQKVGVEYLDQFTDETPLFYSSTSARINREYLLNIDAAPSAFYRVSGSAIYPSSRSWDLEYTNYTGRGLFNTQGNDQEYSGNVYLPFSIRNIPLNLRFSGTHTLRGNSTRTRYNADVNTRLNRLNLRLRYTDVSTGEFNLSPSVSSELSTSATYYIGQQTSLGSIFEGVFLRGQLNYSPNLKEITQSNIQLSRNLFDSGRFQASYSRNFRNDFNLFSVGLTFDFNKVRSSTTLRSSRGEATLNQNILGSIGYDHQNQNTIFSNRQQVGRAGSAIRLFVDNNNSGTYDEGDDIIEQNAIRIGRSGTTNQSEDGIIYAGQLQAYHQLNLEVNQSAIENPLLVSEMEDFSIVTDPNQYKPIDIPFYTSGVISGTVNRPSETGDSNPVAGLRVYLENEDGNVEEQLRTYNDGGFYAYEIPPGTYKIYLDEQQLEFLDLVSDPDTLDIELEALAEGDFKEDLNFQLIPEPRRVEVNIPEEDPSEKIQDPEPVTTDSSDVADEKIFYQIQLASFRTLEKSKQVAEIATSKFDLPFYVVQNTQTDLYAIRSINIDNKNEAIRKLQPLSKNLYESKALVIMKNLSDTQPTAEQESISQVDAPQKRAMNFDYQLLIKGDSAEKIGDEIKAIIPDGIQFSEISDTEVKLTDWKSWQQLLEVATTLRENPDLESITIILIEE